MIIWDVFISHASEQKQIFQPLFKKLDSNFFVWYDDDQILTGEKFETAIETGLKFSAFTIFIFSNEYFDKKWPQTELDHSINKYGKKSFPIAYKISVNEIIKKVPSIKEHKILEITDESDLKIEKIIPAINFALKKRDPITYIVDDSDVKNILLDDLDFNIEVKSGPLQTVRQDKKIWQQLIEFSNKEKNIVIKSRAHYFDTIDGAKKSFSENYRKEAQNAHEGRLFESNVGEDKYGRFTIINGGLVVFRITNLLISIEYYSPLPREVNFQEAEKYTRIVDKKIRLLISKRILNQ